MLLTTAALAALGVAACGVSGQPTASGGGATTSTEQGGGTTFIPATTAPETAPAAGGGGGETGGGTTECKPANLTLSLGDDQAAAGTFYEALRFTNSGKVSCVIVGFPGVSYVTGAKGTQVGAPAVRDGAIGSQITLHPGQVASAIVARVDVTNFDASVCKPTATLGFRVYPPDSTASMFVAQSGMGCAGNPPSPQLRVQTIKPGPGSQ